MCGMCLFGLELFFGTGVPSVAGPMLYLTDETDGGVVCGCDACCWLFVFLRSRLDVGSFGRRPAMCVSSPGNMRVLLCQEKCEWVEGYMDPTCSSVRMG